MVSEDKLPESPGDRSVVNNEHLSELSSAFNREVPKEEGKVLPNFYDNASDDLSMIRAMENNNDRQTTNRIEYSNISKNPQSSNQEGKAFKIHKYSHNDKSTDLLVDN